MSDNQFQPLIDSVRKQTAAVEGKMAEIDQKVDEATASVPNTIKGMSEGHFYIDCLNGNDNNDGSTKSKAVRSIVALLNKMIPGGRYTIYLTAGEHYFDYTILNGDVTFISLTDNAQYRVSTAISRDEPLDLSIYTKITIRKSTNKTARMFSTDTIRFYNCLLSHDLNEGEFIAAGGSLNVTACLVDAKSVQFSVSGYESDDYDVPLTAVSGYGGNVMTEVGWEILAIKGKVNKVIGGNGSTASILAYSNNTLINKAVQSDGTTPSQLFVSSDFRGVVGS